MIKSYFIMAWRSFFKNKISSLINICGLSVGLATGIIILMVIIQEYSFNKFHTHLEEICLLMSHNETSDGISTSSVTPGPLAASIRSEIPEIKYAARVSQGSDELVKAGDKSTYEHSLYAEPDLFNIMSFPALQGDPVAALREPGNAVITERTARKLFGNEEAIGKILVLNSVNTVKVAAVIRDVPQNSSIAFDIVLPFKRYEKGSDWLRKWDDNRILTWVQLKPHVNLAALNVKLKKFFLQIQDEKNITLFAYPFEDLRLYGRFRNGKPAGGVIDIVMMLSFIALFVLLIACINFMNLATARSQQRAREVGMRKALGASRKGIALQFLSEALLLSLLALVLSVILAKLALPGFMRLSGRYFTPNFLDWRLCALLLALGMITGLIAGSYPAFYLSRFQPVKVLKKLMSAEKSGGLLRKGLVTFQFMVSFFLIIATIVIFRQLHYLQNRPIGYNPDNLIEISARGEMTGKFDIIKNELMQIPGVRSVSAGSDNLVRFGAGLNGLQWPGKTAGEDFHITLTAVQYDWVKTAGLQLAEGRDFSTEYGADSTACLINEAAAKRMRLKAPVTGTKINNNIVIGVLKDFVYNNPSASPQPMMVVLNTGALSHFFVRITNNDGWQECLARIEKIVKKTNPDYPFEFRFVKEEYQKNFNEVRSTGQMANTFGAMAIFISCLGLFGLSAFLAEQRNKEISIRKILGASVSSLWFSLSKDFLKPVLIAFVITAPLAGWVMQKMLSKLDYHIQLSWWMFALAGVLVVVVAVATVSFHGIRAALASPIKALKME